MNLGNLPQLRAQVWTSYSTSSSSGSKILLSKLLCPCPVAHESGAEDVQIRMLFSDALPKFRAKEQDPWSWGRVLDTSGH
jgi:hypothetical protein